VDLAWQEPALWDISCGAPAAGDKSGKIGIGVKTMTADAMEGRPQLARGHHLHGRASRGTISFQELRVIFFSLLMTVREGHRLEF
jgi:hypothetical protein